MTEEKEKKPEKREKAKKAPRNTKASEMKASEMKASEMKASEMKASEMKASEMKVGENVVFIGRKPVMNYVLACLTYLNSGSNRIVVKARGRAIPRAVDTVEVLRRSFAKGLQLEGISLSTEEVAREEGQKSKVSAIEISVTKA